MIDLVVKRGFFFGEVGIGGRNGNFEFIILEKA